jgi:hypothetical protein
MEKIGVKCCKSGWKEKGTGERGQAPFLEKKGRVRF